MAQTTSYPRYSRAGVPAPSGSRGTVQADGSVLLPSTHIVATEARFRADYPIVFGLTALLAGVIGVVAGDYLWYLKTGTSRMMPATDAAATGGAA